MLDKLTLDSFQPHTGSKFDVQVADGENLEMELVEVSPMGETRDDQRQAFSCVFRGPEEGVLPQQIYPLKHEKLGELQLFLVPLGPAGKKDPGVLYEAVFT